MWQKIVKPFVGAGELVVIGVVQEQHPERAKLYKQWRQFDWPIFVDSLNLLDVAVVPIPMTIDESGIVRQGRASPRNFADQFMAKAYPISQTPKDYNRAEAADLNNLVGQAHSEDSSEIWRRMGDAYFLRNKPDDLTKAINAYTHAVELDDQDGRAHFRLGVAFRRRFENKARMKNDAQAAVEHWGAALASNPNQYIWRRRIQQYGPRLDKPYNFYFWVDQARKDIVARGETPVELPIEPMGSELAPPARGSEAIGNPTMTNRDPQGRVTRDTNGFVQIESTVTPAKVQPGRRVRVRITLRLRDDPAALWNNEAQNLIAWLDVPAGLELVDAALTFANPVSFESMETRHLECEVTISENMKPGRVVLAGYSLYYVCEKSGGQCRYLRQDFTLPIEIRSDAPVIK